MFWLGVGLGISVGAAVAALVVGRLFAASRAAEQLDGVLRRHTECCDICGAPLCSDCQTAFHGGPCDAPIDLSSFSDRARRN